jgi:hypothetical protein
MKIRIVAFRVVILCSLVNVSEASLYQFISCALCEKHVAVILLKECKFTEHRGEFPDSY